MLAQHFNTAQTPTKETDLYNGQADASAFSYILNSPCSESDESSSSDDSYSSDGSADGDHDAMATISTYDSCPNMGAIKSSPRRPTSLSLPALSDRRASSPSKRSPLYASSTLRSLSHCSSPTSASPRTPSLSMRHDAALRAFQQRQDSITDARPTKAKPSMVDLKAVAKANTPRIEIEQVFDEGEEDTEMIKQTTSDSSIITDRSAARKRMLSALGKGQSKVKMPQPAQRSGSRRMPSLDQISDMYRSSSEEEEVVESPRMTTPGTAAPFHHQRNTSCPTPTSPFSELFAGVEILVTPPTPRPQRSYSPISGVRIAGVHTGADDGFFSSVQRSQTLAPPAFEMAPGKSIAARERATKALAWINSMKEQREQMQMLCKQQRELFISSKQQRQTHAAPSYDMSASFNIMGSPDIILGTTGAPSLIVIQQQRAILAQQQQQMMMLQQAALLSSEDGTNKSRQRTSRPLTRVNSSSQSWRRVRAEKSRNSNDSVSPADSALGWRRKDACDVAPSPKSVYLPPGKRAAMLQQQQQQQISV